MLIRQSPVRQGVFNPETAHFCARLSREIIRAHHLYILRFPEARAIGYFTTSSTVECIYQLAPVMRYSRDHSEHTACIAAFNQAQSILVKLSAYNSVARKALKALNGLAKKWGSRNTTSKGGGNASLGQEELGDFNVSFLSAVVLMCIACKSIILLTLERLSMLVHKFMDFTETTSRMEERVSMLTWASG